jgi:hypothetical protein
MSLHCIPAIKINTRCCLLPTWNIFIGKADKWITFSVHVKNKAAISDYPAADKNNL